MKAVEIAKEEVFNNINERYVKLLFLFNQQLKIVSNWTQCIIWIAVFNIRHSNERPSMILKPPAEMQGCQLRGTNKSPLYLTTEQIQHGISENLKLAGELPWAAAFPG